MYFPNSVTLVPKLRLEEEPRRTVLVERQRDVFSGSFEGEGRTQRNAQPRTERRQDEHDAGRAAELNRRCVNRLGAEGPGCQQDGERASGEGGKSGPAARHTS